MTASRKTRKFFSSFLGFILILSIFLGSFSLLGCNKKTEIENEDISYGQKTVLMIGDGMGYNHVKCAQMDHNDGKLLNMQQLGDRGAVQTASLSVEEGSSTATDSSAGGTSMSTGQRVYNGAVAKNGDGDDIKSITEYAKELGYGVGIVVTDSLCGATPATFSSHSTNRYNFSEIRAQQYTSGIDLFLGADCDYTDGQSSKDPNNNFYASEKQSIVENGYTFVDKFSELSLESDKILGAFNSCPSENGTDTDPTLSMLTDFAFKFMEKHFPNGYFIMIEGSHIDKKSDSWDVKTNTEPMAKYLLDFDNCVGIAQKVLRRSGSKYQLIVTADHETGSMVMSKSLGVYCFYSHSHTNWDVPYFVEAQTCDLSLEIKNTDIFVFMYNFLAQKNYGSGSDRLKYSWQ
ncbi:MAG: alkaline phosphatase [Candidatus Onthoplasma sp.]